MNANGQGTVIADGLAANSEGRVPSAVLAVLVSGILSPSLQLFTHDIMGGFDSLT